MKILCIFLIMLGLMSCVSTKKTLYPKMYAHNPASLLFLPITNKTTSAEAQVLYSVTVAEPLANSGFYVLPIEITDALFKSEGITLGNQLKGVSPTKFKKMFGADAVLAVTIHKWDTNYYVIGGNIQVELECVITSTRTGEVLWNQRKTHTVNTTADSGNLFVNLIATAVQSATVDYIPVAQRLNTAVFQSIPFGKYHKRYQKDQNDRVVK